MNKVIVFFSDGHTETANKYYERLDSPFGTLVGIECKSGIYRVHVRDIYDGTTRHPFQKFATDMIDFEDKINDNFTCWKETDEIINFSFEGELKNEN